MYKGKGIIFAGCSYTWGGGLEYYPPFKDIPNPYAFQYDENKITFATMNFIKANRFSRLVANHFGMWEVNRLNCGGSDDSSIDFLKMCFSLGRHSPHEKGKYDKHFQNIKSQRYSVDEIEYVIFQLTDPFRNYHINLGDEQVVVNIAQIRQRDTQQLNQNDVTNFKKTLDDETFDKFYKFYLDNFKSWEEMENYFINQNLKNVELLFKELESLGIKCKIWSWQTEYINPLKQNSFLNDRFIKLKYEDTEFNCLYDLMKTHPKFKISTSGFLVDGKPVPDDHQTPECHRIIADSIINSIEKDAIKSII
jgi:hypothetical protein